MTTAPDVRQEQLRRRLERRELNRLLGDGGLRGRSGLVAPRMPARSAGVRMLPAPMAEPLSSGGQVIGIGQVLIVSATGQLFASGGAYVIADTIVYQHGFDDVIVAGDSIIWPANAIGTIQVEFAWSSYTGGGTIEIEVDGVVPAWGLVGAGVGRGGKKERGAPIKAGSTVKIKMTQTSGSTQIGDALLQFSIPDPSVPSAPTLTWQFVETVWLETRNNVSASSVGALELNREHRIVIEGNYDPWDGGGPNDFEVLHPSTVPSMGGQRDADTGGNHDVHFDWFTIDLGSGASHIEPTGGPYSTPQPGHIYEYLVTGEGSPVTFRHGDDVITDNNGRFKIDIYQRVGGA